MIAGPDHRHLTRRYAAALGLVAVLLAASMLLVQGLVTAQRDNAALVNVTGRQRMLTQRILSQALQIRAAALEAQRPARLADLNRAVRELRQTHAALMGQDPARPVRPLPPGILERYYAPPLDLDRRLGEFADAAEALARDPAGADPGGADPLPILLDMGNDALLTAVEALTVEVQKDSEAGVAAVTHTLGVLLAALLALLALVGLFIFRPMVRAVVLNQERLRQANRDLERLAVTDNLTGALNRREFMSTVARQVRLADRHGRPLSLVFMDLDHFKRINDEFGHQRGDAVLREFAELVLGRVRGTDFFFRWGGEEFALVAPDTSGTAALALAEELRRGVENHVYSGGLAVTVSMGVAWNDSACTPETLLERADAALYRAKREGRNRVVAADLDCRPGPESGWFAEAGARD